MSDAGPLALVVDQIDADRLTVTHRPMMGPHVIVRADGYSVSIIPEFDIGGMAARATGPGWASQDWDTLPGVVEMALLDEEGRDVLAEPLRRVPFAVAAELLRRALAGDVAGFLSEES